MYKIDAIVRLQRFNELKDALVAQGFDSFTVTEVRGHGAQHGLMAYYRGTAYELPFTRQARVELNVPDPALDVVIECILNTARTGKSGDGKIFVTKLADVIDICPNTPVSTVDVGPTAQPRFASTFSANSPHTS